MQLVDLLGMEVEILNAIGEIQPPSGLPKLNQALLLFEIPCDFWL